MMVFVGTLYKLPDATFGIFVYFYLRSVWPKEVFTPTATKYICNQLTQWPLCGFFILWIIPG